MTLLEFKTMLQIAHEVRAAAEISLACATRLEQQAYRLAGITHVDREPGFLCWRIEGLPAYWETPMQAMQAKEKHACKTS